MCECLVLLGSAFRIQSRAEAAESDAFHSRIQRWFTNNKLKERKK